MSIGFDVLPLLRVLARHEVIFLLIGGVAAAAALRAGDSFTFTTKHGDLDVLATPSGTRGYDELARNAISFDLDGRAVQVASLNDLMRMKTAAGRPKDRIELEILGALRDELEGRPEER